MQFFKKGRMQNGYNTDRHIYINSDYLLLNRTMGKAEFQGKG